MKPSELQDLLGHLLSEGIEEAALRESSAFDLATAPCGNSMIIFGTGFLGCKTVQGLRKLGVTPLAFCDNNQNLWGTKIEGIEVLSPATAVESFGKKASFVVTIWNGTVGHPLAEVKKQLEALGDATVISFAPLYWKYAEVFLPYFWLDLPHKVLAHKKEILKAAGLLEDDYSRLGFLGNILFRLGRQFDALPAPIPPPQYFNLDFFTSKPDELFVDAGAYIGDTIQTLLDQKRSFKEIVALEPDPGNYAKLVDFVLLQNLKNFKICTYQVAATQKSGAVYFDSSGTEQSKLAETGGDPVEGRRLDELLAGKAPSFIKMDIEGAEPEAILGCSDLIRQAPPILAISAYHVFSHLWSILLAIHGMDQDYRFYLRPHAAGGWDYILYAIPPSRLPSDTYGPL